MTTCTLACGLMAAAMLAGSAGPALANAQSLAAIEAADPAAPSVTPYAAIFFAEFHPNSAMDMIGKLPGFGFDGAAARAVFLAPAAMC